MKHAKGRRKQTSKRGMNRRGEESNSLDGKGITGPVNGDRFDFFSLKMCGLFFLSSLLVSSRMNQQGGKRENRNKIGFVSQSNGGLQP